MARIIATILTKNEARHVGDCIKSVSWADAVILSDGFSDDGTVEIAEKMGAVVYQDPFVNFSHQRNVALKEAMENGAEWVFFIDADERCTPELEAEIRATLAAAEAGKEARVGFWIPRYNIIAGHRMRGGGWYPDHQMRLLRPDRATYDESRAVHEYPVIDGEVGYLKEHYIHYNYDTIAQFRRKQDRYSRLEARNLAGAGVRPRPWTYFTMPAREFWRRYVRLGGYKDGPLGLLLCLLMGWYTFKTYAGLGRTEPHPAG